MNPTVSDSTTTSESLSHYSDQIDTNERLTILLVSLVSVSDSSTTSENIALYIPNLFDSVNDVTSITESLSHYIDQIDNMELVTVVVQAATPDSISVSDSTTISEYIDVLHNNSRDVNLAGNYLLDENGSFILDESGSFIFGEGSKGDIVLSSENVFLFLSSYNLAISDLVNTNENNQLVTSLVFIDTEQISSSVAKIVLIKLVVSYPMILSIIVA